MRAWIIFAFVCLILPSCNSEVPGSVKENKISEEPHILQNDTSSILNGLNTQSTLISNSPLYKKLEEAGTLIIPELNEARAGVEELSPNEIDTKLDSIWTEFVEDSIIIHNMFYASTECGVYRIHEDRSETGVMFRRKTLMTGMVDGKSGVIEGCALTGIFEIEFALPLKEYDMFPAIGYQNQVIRLDKC